MTVLQINICIQRHEPARAKAGLSWFGYLGMLIKQNRISMFECMNIAHALKLPRYDLYRLQVAFYIIARNKGAIERCRLRYSDCVLQ